MAHGGHRDLDLGTCVPQNAGNVAPPCKFGEQIGLAHEAVIKIGREVGGMPQHLANSGLFSLGPRATGVAGLWLVGDSTFPGQSTAAVSQGAIRVYHAIRRAG